MKSGGGGRGGYSKWEFSGWEFSGGEFSRGESDGWEFSQRGIFLQPFQTNNEIFIFILGAFKGQKCLYIY